MESLINVLHIECVKIDMLCGPNSQKYVAMIFNPRNRNKIVNTIFPNFTLDLPRNKLSRKIKYVGHIIKNDLHDNNDIQREIKTMYNRTDTLVRRFAKCSSIGSQNSSH